MAIACSERSCLPTTAPLCENMRMLRDPRRTALPPKSRKPALAERRGAASRSAIPAQVLRELHAGRIESRSLVEWLALDLARLAANALPPILGAGAAARVAKAARASAAAKHGIAERTRVTGFALAAELGAGREHARRVTALREHASDTVRGWCAFAVAGIDGIALGERLARIRPFAADAHFGVRELAWMAVRPALAAELERAIALLAAWSTERDANLRRFASEATRPRGVWCAHIARLKSEPAFALPVLEPLRADPEKYVRDSVGNWLNDAAKDQPDWVRATCARWARESPGAETAYVVKRALRSVGE
jgi:3-methyladenine DNA glycosylase AlkC